MRARTFQKRLTLPGVCALGDTSQPSPTMGNIFRAKIIYTLGRSGGGLGGGRGGAGGGLGGGCGGRGGRPGSPSRAYLEIINLILESKLQTIINNTQRTIQKALRVYFCRTCCALSLSAYLTHITCWTSQLFETQKRKRITKYRGAHSLYSRNKPRS